MSPARRPLHGVAAVAACVAALGVLLAAQDRPDRSQPPSLGPPPQMDLPSIQKRTLANGLSVWVVALREVPIVQMNLVVRTGAAGDLPGRFGTASLTAAMLDEGAGERSALELADAVEFLGAVLTTTSSFDASAVRLNAPVERLDEALPLFADVALRPTFPVSELERLRQERLTSLLQARDNPAALAGMAFSRALYGSTHRFGAPMTGTGRSLARLSADDLREFHAAHYQPSNATLLVVGDVSADAVVPKVEKYFGGWRAAAAPATPADVPIAPQPARREIYVIDKPDAEQSQIYVGWVGVPRSTPDYFPLLVLNAVLGGSFTSRLNQNLREERGYTYGAGSVFDMRGSAGPFIAAAGVQTDKTADAMQQFFVELERIRTPVPDDELAKAKNYIALGFPSEFETISDLSRRLEELVVHALPEDYFDRYVPSVLAVTVQGVHRAAERYIQPSRAVVVIVGDLKSIEPAIRTLNFGPVRVMSVDDALGS